MMLKRYIQSVIYGFYPYFYLPVMLWHTFAKTFGLLLLSLFIGFIRVGFQLIFAPILGFLGVLRKPELGNEDESEV